MNLSSSVLLNHLQAFSHIGLMCGGSDPKRDKNLEEEMQPR